MTARQTVSPIEEVVAILVETPPRFAELIAGVDDATLRETPPFGGWSATEVLAHLRSCSDTWGGAITTILEGDTPSLEAVNPNRWIRSTNYRELAFRRSLRAFTTQRAQLLRVLEPLPPDQWERFGNVKVWGAVYERSVLFYARWLARHERSHWKPMARIVGAVRS